MDVQMSLPALATAEMEATYQSELRPQAEDRAKARIGNIARRNAVRAEADRAGRLAASQARRVVYLANGYRECHENDCRTLVTPGYDRCIPHSQTATKSA